MCLAIPMKVVEFISPDKAKVESEGISMEISVSLVDNVSIGDYVIVHTGFAIEIIDDRDAEETLKMLHEIAMTNKESYSQ